MKAYFLAVLDVSPISSVTTESWTVVTGIVAAGIGACSSSKGHIREERVGMLILYPYN
jgi:hypothetical protein